ncbi:TPA: hypothetical protein P0E12_004978 [Vibrio harveyi]|nr:hypothetical protein [Vibrio harveyi]
MTKADVKQGLFSYSYMHFFRIRYNAACKIVKIKGDFLETTLLGNITHKITNVGYDWKLLLMGDGGGSIELTLLFPEHAEEIADFIDSARAWKCDPNEVDCEALQLGCMRLEEKI